MTNKTSLKKHYEIKYADEKNASSISPIRKSKFPGNRFEAAIKYIPEYFSGGDVLELGAGNGNVAKTLLELNNKVSSYCIGDISLPRLEGIKNNIIDDRVKITAIDAEHIPDEYFGKFDLVIMIALIEHLIDPISVMKNVSQVLKPGGFVYIDTPNIAKYTRRIKLLFGRFPATASKNEGLTTYSGEDVDLFDEGNLHYFTFRSLRLMLMNYCGFKRVRKLSYPISKSVTSAVFMNVLSKLSPELFSEIAIIAYK